MNMLSMLTKTSFQPEDSNSGWFDEENVCTYYQLRLTPVGNKLVLHGGFSGTRDWSMSDPEWYTMPKIRVYDR